MTSGPPPLVAHAGSNNDINESKHSRARRIEVPGSIDGSPAVLKNLIRTGYAAPCSTRDTLRGRQGRSTNNGMPCFSPWYDPCFGPGSLFMRRTVSFTALAAFLTLAGGTFAPTPARAQSSDTLHAERARLRAQLDKVNAEIDALKRAGGGVRDDYRLRARLADAESLARRLIDIEARLGIRVDGGAKVNPPQPPPTAEPTDGPADLDAKADILADQSRRVRAQADALGRRATEARSRQELRKRAADLDRDPFAPMEGSKRRIANSAGGTAPPGPAQGGQNINTTGANKNNDAPTATPATPGSLSGAAPPTNSNTTASAPLSSVQQLRDLLDTATLTDIRRLETSGTGAGSLQALERAAAALRARADWLDGQSRAMRAKARAK